MKLFTLGLATIGIGLLGLGLTHESSDSKSRFWPDVFAILASSACDGPEIVYDSNVAGNFGIYRKCVNGGEAKVVVDTPEWHEVYPDPSPDGTSIVYARAKQPFRDSPAEIWLTNLKTSQSEQLTPSGTFPSFSGDGQSVIFERDQLAVIKFDLATKTETQLFPWPGSGFEGRVIAKPRISRDGTWLYYTSDRPARWNAWRANLQTGAIERIGHGCQPAPHGDSDEPIWIAKRRDGRGSDVYLFNRETKQSALTHKVDGNSFGYFPESSPDGKYLLYSACRCEPKTMSHETGNYEIVVVDRSDNTSTPVTMNGATNRWAKILPSAS